MHRQQGSIFRHKVKQKDGRATTPAGRTRMLQRRRRCRPWPAWRTPGLRPPPWTSRRRLAHALRAVVKREELE